MIRIFFAVLLSYIFSLSSSSSNVQNVEEQQLWKPIIAKHEKLLMPQLPTYIELLDKVTASSDVASVVSTTCLSSLVLFKENLQRRDVNAMKMFASTTKEWAGFIFDRDSDFGRYHECLETSFNKSFTRYALFEVHFPRTDTFQSVPFPNSWSSTFRNRAGSMFPSYSVFAMCLPLQCRDGDLRSILKTRTMSDLLFPLNITLFSSQSVGEETFSQINHVSTGALIVVVGVILFSIVGTYTNSSNKFVKCFNLKENHDKLFSTSREINDDRLYVYNFLKAVWVFSATPAHYTMLYNLLSAPVICSFWNYLRTYEWATYLSVISLYINVNTVIAGSLYTISLFGVLGKSPLLLLVVGRFLRTAPVILFGVLLHMTIPSIWTGSANGPLFKEMYVNQTLNCLSSGWRDVMSIGNLQTYDKYCLTVSWFVAVDLHNFILSLPLLLTLKKSLNWGILVAIIQIILGITLHTDYLLRESSSPHYLLVSEADPDFAKGYLGKYAHSIGYISSYPIGILLGYVILHSKRGQRRNYLSFFTFITLISMAYICTIIYDPRGKPNFSEDIGLLWAVLQRPLFVFFMSMFYYFYFMRSDFFINLGRSWLVTFLSRISFTTFIANDVLAVFLHARLSSPIRREGILLFGEGMYLYFLSLLGGYCLSLLVEFPTSNLLKLLLTKERSKNDKNDQSDKNANTHHAKTL